MGKDVRLMDTDVNVCIISAVIYMPKDNFWNCLWEGEEE